MSFTTIIIAVVIASVLVEIFRYRSLKKEEPKNTWKGVISNGLEQLLIVFLSALCALWFTNLSEDQKMNNQIIKVLDFVQEDLNDRLEWYTNYAKEIDADGGEESVYDIKHNAYVNDMVEYFRIGCSLNHNIKLKDFLFNDSVLIRIDPGIASSISEQEDFLLRHEEIFLNWSRDDSDSIHTPKQQMSRIVNGTITLIAYIECEKNYLQGKSVPKDIVEQINNIPANSLEKKQLFYKYFYMFKEDEIIRYMHN